MRRIPLSIAGFLFCVLTYTSESLAVDYDKASASKASVVGAPRIMFEKIQNENSILITVEGNTHTIDERDITSIISMEGYEPYMSPGNPILPHKVLRIALPPNADMASVTAAVFDADQQILRLEKPIQPAPPFAAWDGIRTIYTWGEGKDIENGYNQHIYKMNAFFPSGSLNVLPCAILRKWEIAQIDFFPVLYNPVNNMIRIINKAHIVISYDLLPKLITGEAEALADMHMEDTAADLIDNYAQSRYWYASTGKAMPTHGDFDYVIITTNNIKNGSNKLSNFEDFKETQGFNVLIVTEDNRYEDIDGESTGSGWGGDTGDTAANNIRSWLATNYASMGIEYVLLIGDPTPINGGVPMKMCWPRNNETYEPTHKNAPTDYFFADLTGNWDLDGDGSFGEYPDDFGTGGVDAAVEIYVGRIPVYGSAFSDLDDILEKTIAYGTASGELNWRKKVLLPMEPLDDITDGYPLGEGIRNHHSNPNGWSSYRIYDENYGCLPEETPCNPTNVENEWKNNYGLVTWWTHGSATNAQDIFNTSQCSNLNNDYPSFTFQCSCNNGYPEVTDNLGYSLLKEGAIGTISASRVSWYLPGNSNWNSNGTNSYLAYEYSGKIIKRVRCGKALYDVKMASSNEDPEYWMNMLDFNLYGDPALGINDPAWENVKPILSNPRVIPVSGTESTTFEFLVDYYDPDGDPPHDVYRKLYIIGRPEGTMELKSGTAANGTYHYTTTLTRGSYSYYFFFADTALNAVMTDWQSGPWVYAEGNVPINIVIQCTKISSDLKLQYSLTGLGGPWVDIPITKQILDPVLVPAGSKVWFEAGVDGPNFEYREWEGIENGERFGGGTSTTWWIQLGTETTEIGLNVYYRYTPQYYTISGTVLRSDSTLVPGGVDLMLTSSEQTLAHHTDDGNFAFTEVKGGVSVTITPSANGYGFSPPSLVYNNLKSPHIGVTIHAYAFDYSAPMAFFLNLPDAISQNSAVSFSWGGEDDISAPANLLYQYKLDGVDSDWSPWVPNTSQSYNLPNGAYTFWVRPKDEAGNINQAPISYTFVVNAAPKVVSAARVSRSVWASRVTLEMPVGATNPTETFILLPEHSGIFDSELVPVTIHRADETAPCGAHDMVADEMSVTASIFSATKGWLVTLPESIAAGSTVQYDIVWGKIKYFGWQEFVPVPLRFANACMHIRMLLDKNMRIWRMANNHFPHGAPYDTDSIIYMNASDKYGSLIDETALRFSRGHAFDGSYAEYSQFGGLRICELAQLIYFFWRDFKTTWDGSTNNYYYRICVDVFNSSGNWLNTYDGQYHEGGLSAPVYPINSLFWIVGDHNQVNPREAWFLVMDANGNEIIPKTIFYTFTKPRGPGLSTHSARRLGSNVLLIWTQSWDTENDDRRQQIAYQVRDLAGGLVKDTTILTPTVPDSEMNHDTYDLWDNLITDNNGKVWLSYERSYGGTYACFYVVMSTNGDIWKGPIQTANFRSFDFCDKDGKIWASQGGQFFVLNDDDSIYVPPRSGAWTPTQNIGQIAALVQGNGYCLYDRWSPQVVRFDVLPDAVPHDMDLYDLNLWDNDLHTANLTIKKDDRLIWSQTGTFTGHATVNVSGVFDTGSNLLVMTQNDFLGGQVLATFPYATPTPTPTPTPLQIVYDFTSDQQGWTTGGATIVFTPPNFAWEPSFLTMTSRTNTNTFGYWQSPQDAVPADANYLYRARFSVSTDLTDQALVPQLRVRANSLNLQQYDVLSIESAGDGGASPVLTGTDYDLYFVPPSNDTAVTLAFDLLNFNPDDAAVAELSLDTVIVERYALESLSTSTVVQDYTFELSQDGWTTGGAPIFFSPPQYIHSSGALELRATTNTNTFGFWGSDPADITIEADRLYRGSFEVRTDVTDPALVPEMRLRFNTGNLQVSHTFGISSSGDGANSPGTTNTTYDRLYFLPPSNCVGEDLLVSFDILNFNPDDAAEASLILDRATIESLPLPAAP